MTWPLRGAVATYITRSPTPAHAMLAVALASQGARLRRTHVEHDGRRLRVAICDAPKGPGEVTPMLVFCNPMRAALDVLVACREHGTPLDRRRVDDRPARATIGRSGQDSASAEAPALLRTTDGEAPRSATTKTPLAADRRTRS